MTMREMKDSGVEWIGEIPKLWEIIPNKYVMRKTKDIRPVYKGESVLSLTLNGVVVRDLENPSGKMPTTFDGYQFIRKGNLLMCLFDIDVTPRCIGLIQHDGVCSPAYSQFILNAKGYAPYFYYYYLSLDFSKVLLHLAKNLRHSLTEEQLGNVPIPCPPIKEQIAIASFLDSKCSEIDALTADIEKQIETLQEYKKSVITEVVTKGLNPNAEMKDSGVEWIGKIPTKWKIKKLKYLCDFSKGLSITKADLKERGKAVVSYGQIHAKLNTGTKVDSRMFRFVDEAYVNISPKSICHKNDFIFADTSEDYEGAGNCVFVDVDNFLFAGYHTFIVSPTKYIGNPKFLAYLFQAALWRQQIRSKVSGIKVYSITQRIIKEAEVIFPDELQEQNDTVDFLDFKCSEIDAIITKKQDQLSTLAEYKKSLIYEYVTGKKTVPNS